MEWVDIAITYVLPNLLIPFFMFLWKRVEIHSNQLFIGVVNPVIPDCLKIFPDFVSVNKAKISGQKICIIHCRHLSYALRKCDFVVCDAPQQDPKIKRSDDDFWSSLSAQELH